MPAEPTVRIYASTLVEAVSMGTFLMIRTHDIKLTVFAASGCPGLLRVPMSSCPRLASLLALAFTAATQAYIPAQPGSSGPLSGTAHREELYLGIQWYPQIFLTAPIRRQALGSAHSVNNTVLMLVRRPTVYLIKKGKCLTATLGFDTRPEI